MTRSGTRTVTASAPTRIDLAGGTELVFQGLETGLNPSVDAADIDRTVNLDSPVDRIVNQFPKCFVRCRFLLLRCCPVFCSGGLVDGVDGFQHGIMCGLYLPTLLVGVANGILGGSRQFSAIDERTFAT